MKYDGYHFFRRFFLYFETTKVNEKTHCALHHITQARIANVTVHCANQLLLCRVHIRMFPINTSTGPSEVEKTAGQLKYRNET